MVYEYKNSITDCARFVKRQNPYFIYKNAACGGSDSLHLPLPENDETALGENKKGLLKPKDFNRPKR